MIALVTSAQFASAQSDPEAAAYAHKLGSQEVWENAKAGKVQRLLVELNVGFLDTVIARERVAISDETDRRRAAAGGAKELIDAIDAEAKTRDAAVVAKLKSRLRAAKDGAFPDGQLAGARVVYDFSVLPVVMVEVPDLESLRAVLNVSTVRLVNINGQVKPAAD
ncbi:hypothetical protein [Ideonella sp.]|uniref:hypothetical protein n=1 Tax=Ideonella sp. TaxID=1929293 RepID=UPI0035B10638